MFLYESLRIINNNAKIHIIWHNRIPIYNAISATKVDIDISTLTQVGI